MNALFCPKCGSKEGFEYLEWAPKCDNCKIDLDFYKGILIIAGNLPTNDVRPASNTERKNMKYNNKWEEVDENGCTERMELPGGWLVRTTIVSPSRKLRAADQVSVALTFVPDLSHYWAR